MYQPLNYTAMTIIVLCVQKTSVRVGCGWQEARGQAGYDYKDGYGNYGYDYRRDYGTYPGTAKPYDSRSVIYQHIAIEDSQFDGLLDQTS